MLVMGVRSSRVVRVASSRSVSGSDRTSVMCIEVGISAHTQNGGANPQRHIRVLVVWATCCKGLRSKVSNDQDKMLTAC